MANRRPPKRGSAHRSSQDAAKPSESTGETIAVAIDRVSTAALAKILGVDVRSIANFVDDGMPKDARGEFLLAKCVQWYVDRERERARAAKSLNDLDRARLRKTEAEATKAELEAKQLHGDLIPRTDVEDIVGDVCDRLRPPIMNLSSSYGMRLEELGVNATQAEETLDRIAEDLLTALRGTADDLDELAEHDGSEGSDDASRAS
jgi:phage terminase Nu1 subunit (DNA packaging protein)